MQNKTQHGTRPRRALRSRLAIGLTALMAAAGFAWGVTPALVTVDDEGNAADATGYGAVDRTFRIGTHEVTRAEYAAFLNAVAATDSHGLYNPNMGIARSGSPGSYAYAAAEGTKSVAYVSWYDAARYANWLHNGQPAGGGATTEDGAYAFGGESSVGPRKAGARFFLPSEDEWFKAAYYQGGEDAFYWRYPTRSDSPPLAAPPPGDDNTANYDEAVGAVAAVGAYGGTQGYYGTRDQAGNLWEWNESVIEGDRGLRGGSYDDYELLLEAWFRDSQAPADENEFVGFRVAAAADETPPPPVTTGFVIKKAEYSKDKDRLRVEGEAAAGAKVTIVNAANGALLGTVTARSDKRWRLEIAHPATVPSRVRATCNGVALEATVAGAPTTPVTTRFVIKKAEYEKDKDELRVEGEAPPGAKVKIVNAVNGALLGMVTTRSDRRWRLDVEHLATMPARVRATCNGVSVEMRVDD